MKLHYDLPLIGVTFFLICWGTIMVYSTSAVYADLRYQDNSYFLQKHLFHLLVGIAGLMLASSLNYRQWQRLSPWLMLGMLVLLILVLIPEIGTEVKGGRRWIRFASFGVQPAELLKVVLIIYVASYLERKQAVLSSFFRGLTPNFIVTSIYLFLVLLQPDFGTAVNEWYWELQELKSKIEFAVRWANHEYAYGFDSAGHVTRACSCCSCSRFSASPCSYVPRFLSQASWMGRYPYPETMVACTKPNTFCATNEVRMMRKSAQAYEVFYKMCNWDNTADFIWGALGAASDLINVVIGKKPPGFP